MSRYPESVKTRLLNNIKVNEAGCWIWQRTLGTKGYGNISVAGRPEHTHVVAYREFIGAVPYGLELDHLCRVRACCNPKHLEAVTHQENCRRGIPFRVRSTHCKHGHAYTAENTRIRGGDRFCRACGRDRINRFREKQRMVA